MDDGSEYYLQEEEPVTGEEYDSPGLEQDIFRGPLYWGNFY